MKVYRAVDYLDGITPPIKRKTNTSNLVTSNVDYGYGNEEYRKPEIAVQGVSEMDFL